MQLNNAKARDYYNRIILVSDRPDERLWAHRRIRSACKETDRGLAYRPGAKNVGQVDRRLHLTNHGLPTIRFRAQLADDCDRRLPAADQFIDCRCNQILTELHLMQHIFKSVAHGMKYLCKRRQM